MSDAIVNVPNRRVPLDPLMGLGLSYTRPAHGDAQSADAWARLCDAAERTQTVRFAVAPGCSVTHGTHALYRGGEEISANGDATLAAALCILAQRRALIEVSEEELQRRLTRGPAAGSRYRVSVVGRMSLQSPSGHMFLDGEGIAASDLASTGDETGEAALAGFIERGLIIDTRAKP